MKTILLVTAALMLASAAHAEPLTINADDVRGYYGLLAYEKCNPGSFNPKLLDGIQTLIAVSALTLDTRWIKTQMMSLSCFAIGTLYTPEKVARVNSLVR